MRLQIATTLTLAFAVASAAQAFASSDSPGSRAHLPRDLAAANAELEIAKRYEQLFDWKDAELHYIAAAKDPASENAALDALVRVRKRIDGEQASILDAGKKYEEEEQWSQAEDLYRLAAVDPNLREELRQQAVERLSTMLNKQQKRRYWNDSRELVQGVLEVIAVFLATLVAIATTWSILKRRKTILVRPFTTPSDELTKTVAVHLRYARDMMRFPGLAPAGRMPATLVSFMVFDEETEAIEDIEVAGSKIPFAALGKLFGRPSVQVGGGFDGVAPTGIAFSSIETRTRKGDDFVQHDIRIGVPDQQRQDLQDFAYDVVRKASTAYAIV